MKKLKALEILFIFIFLMTSCTDKYKGNTNGIKYRDVLQYDLALAEMPNELEYGGEIICLGIGSAYRLKKHLFEDYQKSYDELMIVNANLPPKVLKYSLEEQIMMLGVTPIKECFLVLKMDSSKANKDNYHYYVEMCDSDGMVLKTIDLDFLTSGNIDLPLAIISDDNNIFLAWEDRYCEVSYKGETQFYDIPSDYKFYRYILLPEGNVALDLYSVEYKNGEVVGIKHKITKLSHNKNYTLVNLQYDELDERLNWLCAVNFYLNEQLLLADMNGIYLSDKDMKNMHKIFDWRENEISISYVYNLTSNNSGTIFALVENDKMPKFILLRPNE